VIYNVKNNDGRKDRVQQVIEFVRQTGGLEYAIQTMQRYRDEALTILRTFPASPSRTSLEQLINYTIEREM
jgi:octaprenyl-diphosphate synthase